MTTSNTGDNRADQGRFKKGDPRINRKGRPKSFDTFRREAIKIAGEIINDANGVPLISRANAILMDWALSKDVRKQQLLVEYAFGKVPNEEDVTIKLSWREKVKEEGHDPDELFAGLVEAATTRARATTSRSSRRSVEQPESRADAGQTDLGAVPE